MSQLHFLFITYPMQGHLNPSLQFAKRLVRSGASVTFATTVFTHRRMTTTGKLPQGLSFVVYSDGYDDGFKPGLDDHERFISEIRRRSKLFLTDLIQNSRREGVHFSCLVYTMLLPWAADVARDLHILSALLWIQPAAVLDIYYYYFYGYGDSIRNNADDPSFSIKLPGLPLLAARDLPSLLIPSDAYLFALPTVREQLEKLREETNPKVLVNTFDALEPEALRSIQRFNMVGVGPLIPSAFLDGDDPSDTSFGGDLFQGSKDYLKWLDSKPKSSVVYVSFGSIAILKKHQVEELARGLIESGYPFLWVIRGKEDGEEDEIISCREELKQQGTIVPWCAQVEVLSHPAVGCFVTHCGWNSTLESLSTGKPVVAFPQWTDQGTNAKFLEDVWRTGVRVRENGEGLVESGEIRRCLDVVMGGARAERLEEMRRSAEKWKVLAREAVGRGGSSDVNLRAFIQEVGKGSNQWQNDICI